MSALDPILELLVAAESEAMAIRAKASEVECWIFRAREELETAAAALRREGREQVYAELKLRAADPPWHGSKSDFVTDLIGGVKARLDPDFVLDIEARATDQRGIETGQLTGALYELRSRLTQEAPGYTVDVEARADGTVDPSLAAAVGIPACDECRAYGHGTACIRCASGGE